MVYIPVVYTPVIHKCTPTLSLVSDRQQLFWIKANSAQAITIVKENGRQRENLTDLILAANPDILSIFLALKYDHGYCLP